MLRKSLRQQFAVSLLALLAVLAAHSAHACEWLQYEPHIESIRGTLKVRSYDDPRENGSPKMQVMVLELPTPVCVHGAGDDDFNVEVRDVQRIQVVYNQKMRDSLRALLQKKVVLNGTLFHAQTAQHVETILITVASAEAARDDG
jgi:hypothetical protein